MLPDGRHNQLRVQSRVLGPDNQVQGDGVPPSLHGELGDERNQIHLHLAALCLLGLLEHHQALPAQQVPDGGLRPKGRAVLILQGDDIVDIGQGLHRLDCLVALLHCNPLGQHRVHPPGHFAQLRTAPQLELQHLALAGKAHGQGQRNGHKGVGIEALGMGDLNSRPEKSPLEGTHQIQM